jgi:hypothetical protein
LALGGGGGMGEEKGKKKRKEKKEADYIDRYHRSLSLTVQQTDLLAHTHTLLAPN